MLSADSLKSLALVGIVAAIVLFANLGGPRLWDRDEPRNAGCAREMLDRGDWIVPTFNGELRAHKPVLLYWCIMSAYHLLGVSEFTARLPSALAGLVTVLCTFTIGRRLYGRSAGGWAAIVLSTSLLFVMAGRAATPDSILIACTTLAMTAYVLGTFRSAAAVAGREPVPLDDGRWFPQRTSTVIVMYAAMGLAVLAKGPVGFLLPCAVIGLFRLIMRLPADRPQPATFAQRLGSVLRPFGPRHFLATLWSMRPLLLIAVVVVVAGPWYWAVGDATQGEFLHEFLLVHNVQRATRTMEGHAGNLLFFPATVIVGLFPWSVFTAPIGIDLKEQLRQDTKHGPAIIFSFCWVAVYVALFSLSRTKLPNYVTPCFPALALLTGHYVSRWGCRAYSGRWLRVGLGCYVFIGTVICAAIPILVRRFLPGEEWLGAIGLAPLVGGGLCLWLAARQDLRRAGMVFAVSAAAFTTLIFAVGTQRVDRHQQSHVLLRAIHSRAVDPQIASYDILEPSWVYYGGRRITELPRWDSTRSGDPQSPVDQLLGFLEQSPSSFVITRQEHARDLQPVLPSGVVVLAEADRFLSSQRLVVLGRDTVSKPGGVRTLQASSVGSGQRF